MKGKEQRKRSRRCRGREQRAAIQGGRGWRAGAAAERLREEQERFF